MRNPFLQITLLLIFLIPKGNDDNLYAAFMLPVADGHFPSRVELCCTKCCEIRFAIYNARRDDIKVGVSALDCRSDYPGCSEFCLGNMACGIIEYDLESIRGLFASGKLQARISLTVQSGALIGYDCLSIYYIIDENENGINDIGDATVVVDGVCPYLQPGDTLTFDVTPAVEYFLFGTDQTTLSGFLLKNVMPCADSTVEFFDHTDYVHGPTLYIMNTDTDDDDILDDGDNSGIPGDFPCTGGQIENCDDNCPVHYNPDQMDSEGDGTGDVCDNCPNYYNPDQEDTLPPQGNSIGDACECEADFMCDGDVDGSDASMLKFHFGRSVSHYPCTALDPCRGDFSCDGDVDGTDASLFKQDFGRSSIQNPCPGCVAGEWCTY